MVSSYGCFAKKKKVLLIILQLFSLVRKVLAKQDGFIPLFLLNYKNSFMKGTFKPRIRKRKKLSECILILMDELEKICLTKTLMQ